MKSLVLIVAACLAACGAGSTASSAASPVITGDMCTVHQDATSCRADTRGCNWYPNTRPCQVDQPCPAGWCSHPQPVDGGGAVDGGISASAGCACPGASTDACMMQIGGPAIQVQPPIICEPVPATCALLDRCECLTSSTNGTCRSSDQVSNLCSCDNGIR
jgi:hypothetical protein